MIENNLMDRTSMQINVNIFLVFDLRVYIHISMYY